MTSVVSALKQGSDTTDQATTTEVTALDEAYSHLGRSLRAIAKATKALDIPKDQRVTLGEVSLDSSDIHNLGVDILKKMELIQAAKRLHEWSDESREFINELRKSGSAKRILIAAVAHFRALEKLGYRLTEDTITGATVSELAAAQIRFRRDPDRYEPSVYGKSQIANKVDKETWVKHLTNLEQLGLLKVDRQYSDYREWTITKGDKLDQLISDRTLLKYALHNSGNNQPWLSGADLEDVIMSSETVDWNVPRPRRTKR